MELSRESQKFLTNAGWNTTRHVNIASYLERLQAEGYKINHFAEEFLAQFGGLELFQPAYRVKYEYDKLHFNPLSTCDNIYKEQVENYEERVGDSLVVVGEAHNGYLVLMISEKGKVYGAYDNYLTLLGNDYFEALDSLFLCKETPEVI